MPVRDSLIDVLGEIQRHLRQARLWMRLRQTRQIYRDWQAIAPAGPVVGPTCLLDIRQIVFDGEQGRRFHALVSLLRRSGYEVWLVPHLSFLQSGRKGFKWQAIRSTRVFRPGDAPPQFDLCLTDRRRQHDAARRTIQLTCDTTRPLDVDEIALPYSFYPSLWEAGEFDKLADYRDRLRRWKLFFGGNCQQKSYRKLDRFRRLATVNRYDLLNACLKYHGPRTVRIESRAQFDQSLTTDHNGFVMIDSDDYRLEPDLWLTALSTADFFLAAPGVDYPLAHNCIEALAIGTVPILEYGSLLQPPLVDGVNCLEYRGADGFVDVLARLHRLSRHEIVRLRAGASRYFDEHLSPVAFRRQLGGENTRRVHVFSYLAERAA